MPKVFTSQSQRTGERGERIAVKYLENKGFTVIERNYTKKWGELDIVARKGRVIHFIEVKSKSVLNLKGIPARGHRLEEGMHGQKVARLKRTIQTYLLERRVPADCDWRFDLILVHMSDAERQARVEMLENLIL